MIAFPKWKPLVAATMLAVVIPTTSSAADGTVNKSFEEAWKLVLQAIAMEGASITHSDREAGVVQATGALNTAAVRCRTQGGRIEKADLELTLIVKPINDSSSFVSTKATIRATWYRYRKIIVIRTSRVFHEAVCDAPEIEQRVLSRLGT